MSEKTRKTILVTGANGFIGSHLSLALTKKGYNVIGLIFGKKGVIPALQDSKHFRPASGDIRDFKKTLDIFKKYRPHGVFHTAAVIPVSLKTNAPFIFFETNTKGTLNLLEAGRRTKVKKFIFSSTMEVYGKDIKKLPVSEDFALNPVNAYGESKVLAEELCRFYSREYGLKVVILRYAGVFGPKRKTGAVSDFFKNALLGKSLEIKSNISWDIVYVKDVVLANILALEKADKMVFEIINIGSGKPVNIKDLAQKIKKVCDSQSKLKIKSRMPGHIFYFDIKKAKNLLGFKPMDLDRAMREYFLEIKKTKA